MKSSNFKIDKWSRELKSLLGDVTYLQQNNHDFLDLAKKWNNKELEANLWFFAKRNYISYMSMAIRRLCDDHKDTISLWKLISDIGINANAVKRKWFLEKWPDAVHESAFKEFFGESDVLSSTVIETDLKALVECTDAIKIRADKFEAHKDKKQILEVEPTFNDLDEAVKVICNLYQKYYYLLLQRSLSI